MSIYQSTKVMPYVYMGIHKITGEFYIGYREANVALGRASSEDLPIYRTSSKIVKPNFNDYNWCILVEFYTGNDAYDFEQQLIHESWGNPLLLNEVCHYNNKGRFRPGPHSNETKQKIGRANKGRIISEDRKRQLSDAGKGRHHSEETKQKISSAGKGRVVSNETRQKLSNAWKERVTKPLSEEHKRKISLSLKGKQKGPQSEEHKRKISEAVKKRH